MDATFPPTRTAALDRLSAFLPHAGRDYASLRNYDRPGHPHVSRLSPYIRRRLLTEPEVLEAVLGRFSLSSAEKFVQEVYWRTYWKGWLEMRPSVWMMYQTEVTRGQNRVATESGLRADWKAACKGETGIDCFDHWARELVDTGYLHNHARMWFASIWIFTLRLPWALGADFFLRHLLDGDPASNTLSWRWVAGLQTQGKTYLARTSNISKYTDGRFHPQYQLASDAPPLDGPPHPPRQELPLPQGATPGAKHALLLTDDDMAPGYILKAGIAPICAAQTSASDGLSPSPLSKGLKTFIAGAQADVAARYEHRLGAMPTLDPDLVEDWFEASGADELVTPYAPVGPNAALLARLASKGLPVRQIRRSYDAEAWPYATAGFFKFKAKIPMLTANLKQMSLV